ncbi:MAG TPA: phenylalanine--tRNA ligase subunit beta, partial [Flavisolibacter sp.]|nr:phenylalanine--tRNA ligase subunit beta [Flavisolibacter sp.]
IKGIAEAILTALGIKNISFENTESNELQTALTAGLNGEKLIELGRVQNSLASKFDIKQPVFFADIYWDVLLKYAGKQVQFKEISKYPSVERDLALIVPKSMKYQQVKEQLSKLRLNKLQDVKLFDVFESEKFGAGKKSMAVNFTFMDEEKTLTDKEIDSWMNKIMATLEKELNAEIRK